MTKNHFFKQKEYILNKKVIIIFKKQQKIILYE